MHRIWLPFVFVFTYIFLEVVWFTFTSGVYKKHFQYIQPESGGKFLINKPAAIVSYIILFSVVWYFIVKDVKTYTVQQILMRSVMLGLATYGVYNATNLATLRNYKVSVALMDTCWGIFAIATVSLVTFYLDKASTIRI